MTSFSPSSLPISRPWWQVRLLMVLVAIGVLLTLGRVPLIDEDEGEYSEVAAEMAANGNYFAPTLNGQAFYEKPILLFWLQAPLIHLVGPQEWAFRLPSVLASLAWVFALLHWWGRRARAREAELAAWIGVLGLGMTIAGRAATMDSLILLWITLTLFDMWSYVESNRSWYLRRAAVWAALGFLTKGPIAVLIPLLVFGVYLASAPLDRHRWKGLLDKWAWCTFILVAAPWFIWYGLHSDGVFWQYFFLRENIGRVGGSLQGHSGSPAYYLIVLPFIFLPYSSLLIRVIRGIPEYWQRPIARYLIIWFGVVLVVFTLAGAKLPHYLLYGCTPLFILAAPALLREGKTMWRWGLVIPGLLLPILALALPELVAHFSLVDPNPYIREMLSRGGAVFDTAYYRDAWIWLSFSVAIAMAIVIRFMGSPAYPYLVLLPGLVSAIGISWILIPAVSQLQQDPVRAAAQFAKTLKEPVVSDNRMPSFSVYLGHATEIRKVQEGDIAFGRVDHPDQLGSQHQILFAQGGVRVVRVLQP